MRSDKEHIDGYFDGACGPRSPGGHMGFGCYADIIDSDGIKARMFSHSEYYPATDRNTCNVAEYLALFRLLRFFITNKFENYDIMVYGDSDLVIKQMSGNWSIKSGHYTSAALKCKELVGVFADIKFRHIHREFNTLADELSKKGLTDNGINVGGFPEHLKKQRPENFNFHKPL
jgi:ribonuclease HI